MILDSTCDCCGLTYIDVDEGPLDWKTLDEVQEDVLDGLLDHALVLAAMLMRGWDVICGDCMDELVRAGVVE